MVQLGAKLVSCLPKLFKTILNAQTFYLRCHLMTGNIFYQNPRTKQANSGIVPSTIDSTTIMAPNLAVSAHEITVQYSTVPCKTGFTFSAHIKVLLRLIEHGPLHISNHIRAVPDHRVRASYQPRYASLLSALKVLANRVGETNSWNSRFSFDYNVAPS